MLPTIYLKTNREIYCPVLVHAILFFLKNFAVIFFSKLHKIKHTKYLKPVGIKIFQICFFNLGQYGIFLSSLFANDVIQYKSLIYVFFLSIFTIITEFQNQSLLRLAGIRTSWAFTITYILISCGEYLFAYKFAQILAPISLQKYKKVSANTQIVNSIIIRMELESLSKCILITTACVICNFVLIGVQKNDICYSPWRIYSVSVIGIPIYMLIKIRFQDENRFQRLAIIILSAIDIILLGIIIGYNFNEGILPFLKM
ncbi:hypothetical protein NUSPORA_01525 [Nucleospora cyclopteri]